MDGDLQNKDFKVHYDFLAILLHEAITLLPTFICHLGADT